MKEDYPQIFINYAKADNTASSTTPGWVESFSYVLKLMTVQILKKELNTGLKEEFACGEAVACRPHSFVTSPRPTLELFKALAPGRSPVYKSKT